MTNTHSNPLANTNQGRRAAIEATAFAFDDAMDAVMDACFGVVPDPALMDAAERAVSALELLCTLAGSDVFTSDITDLRLMLDARATGLMFDDIADRLEARYAH